MSSTTTHSVEQKPEMAESINSRKASSSVADNLAKDIEKQTPVGPDSAPAPGALQEPEWHGWKKIGLIMLSLYLSVFLFAIDRTIIATAIPTMTDEFNSFADVGWYGSAFTMTTCAFILTMARVYTFYNPKWVFLGNLVVFEIGSAICGAAPSSPVFIVGRAIAGLGSGGGMTGVMVIITRVVPLHKRPMFTGFFGAVFGIASVIGPLLGGVFTTDVSWRWCFYINLPIGAVTIFVLFFILKIDAPPQNKDLSLREKINRLDPIGTVLIIACMVTLLLALQWGGITYAWGSGRIIALLVISAASGLGFIGVQLWKQENGTVPPRIFVQRTVMAASAYNFCVYAAMLVIVYYLPFYFQALKGSSAVRSGIQNLPLVLSMVIMSIFAGIGVTKFGYYVPPMIAAAVLMPIGAGMIATLTATSSTGAWVGYQLIFGFGMGLGMQQGNLAVQAVLSLKDIPTGVSLIFFVMNFGGSIFISVAQSVLSNKLASGVAGVPGLKNHSIANIGATDLRKDIDAQYLPQVLAAYQTALHDVFYVAVGLSAFLILPTLFIEWKDVRKGAKGKAKPNSTGGDKEKVAVAEKA